MSYNPDNMPVVETLEDVREYVFGELQQIAQEFNGQDWLMLVPRGAAPLRPREGMVLFADGVAWNPGFGKGLYVYAYDVWVPLINVGNPPALVSTISYTVAPTDNTIIVNSAVDVVLTLPNPTARPGRMLRVKTIQSILVSNIVGNVIPLQSTVAGTIIIPATGKNAWADLVAADSFWVITAGA